MLEKLGGTVECFSTDGPKTAGAIARRCIERGAGLIVAAGGDGTINEVVEGMAGSQVPLAILPGGTANVLANEIGLSSHIEGSAARIPECVEQRVSVGMLTLPETGESKHFLLMAGAGLDAHIVYRLDAGLKAKLGKFAYWIYGFGEFGRSLEEFEVTAGGKTYSCSFALISKVRNYGGDFEIAHSVTLADDEFEVVLFEGSNSFRYFVYLAGVAARQHRHIPGVTVLRATEVCIASREGEQVHLQIDGEYAGLTPAKIGIVRDALTLLIPPAYKSKLESC
jgi:diacylglycerol kinase (ATP)